MDNKYRPVSPKSQLTDEEIVHLEVVSSLDKLDRMKPFVAIGFFIFWAFLAVGVVIWFFVYILPFIQDMSNSVQGWF